MIQPILNKYPRMLEYYEVQNRAGIPLYRVQVERLYHDAVDAWSLSHVDDWKWLGTYVEPKRDVYDYLWGIFDRATACIDGSTLDMPKHVRINILNDYPQIVRLELKSREFLNMEGTEIVDEEFNYVD